VKTVMAMAVAFALMVASCSGGPDDSVADSTSVRSSASSSGETGKSEDPVSGIVFASAEELADTLGLSGCRPSEGPLLELPTPADVTLACGDTGEIQWFESSAELGSALSETEEAACSRFEGEWSFLVGGNWFVTMKLPLEPRSDRNGLRIVQARGPAGRIVTYDCGEGGREVSGSGGVKSGSDIDPCLLLTPDDLSAVTGKVVSPEPTEPAGPFTGCDWGGGTAIVSLATTDEPILAPGQEEECPSADLGDRSFVCPGKVTVLVGGIQYSVTTVDPGVEEADLISLAGLILLRLTG